MALDREQVGLLFKVSADSTDARRDLELFQGVAEGVALEIRDQFERLGTAVNQSMERSTRSLSTFTDQLGDSARGQLAGFLGQFGLIGDAAAGMIPAVSGAGAAVLGLGGLAVGAAAGMQQLVARTTEFTGKIDDLAQVTGLTNESIQSLRLASVLAGQSFESVASTAVIFQRQMQEAQRGNEELRQTFKALGVDLEGDVDTAFRRTLESLNGLSDGSKKTSTAVELFGRSGALLLPVMDQVDGKFNNLIQRARQLGIILTEQDIKAANDFQDQLDLLNLKLEGVALRLGARVIPAVEKLAITMVFGAGAATTYLKALEDAQKQMKATSEQAALGAFQGPGIDPLTGLPSEVAKPKTVTGRTAATGPTKQELNERNIRELEALEKSEQAQQNYYVQSEKMLLADEQSRRASYERQARDRERLNQANIDAMEAEDQAAYRSEQERLALEKAILRADEAEIAAHKRKLAQKEADLREHLQRYREQLLLDPSSPLSMFGEAGQRAAEQGAGLFGQMAVSANEALGQISDNLANFQSIAADAFNNVAQGLEQVILTFIKTGQISGKVFKEMAAQIIASVAAQAAVKAIFELAEGFASLALAWVMPSMAGKAAGHFKAAAIYGSVAGIAIAAGAAMAGSVGPGENRFLESGGARGTRIMEQGREPVVVVVRAETEPGVIVRHVVTDYKANGETRQMLRRDLLAEAF